MSVISAALRELMAAGLEGEALVDAVARIEAAREPVRTARQERNRRYYEKKTSEKRLNASYSDVSDDQDAAEEKEKAPTPPKEKPKNPPTGVKKVETHSAEFERFRQAYPKRDGGHGWSKAGEFFEAHRRAGVDPEDLIRAAGIYAADCKRRNCVGSEYVMQAVTFLRGRHWPEWLERAPAKPRADGWPLSVDQSAARAAFERGSWPMDWGPKPGVPGCKIPESVQREWLSPSRHVA